MLLFYVEFCLVYNLLHNIKKKSNINVLMINKIIYGKD